MRFSFLVISFFITGCAQVGMSTPETPPPFPSIQWSFTGDDADVSMDGLAVVFEAGQTSALAIREDSSTRTPPWLIRTQIWKMAGRTDRRFGIALGAIRAGEEWRCLVVEVRHDGNVRLVEHGAGSKVVVTEWSEIVGPALETAFADPNTGTLIIRELAISADRGSLVVSMDGYQVLSREVSSTSLTGRIGLYAEPGVRLRVPYLTQTERELLPKDWR